MKTGLEEFAERTARAFDNDNYKPLMELIIEGAIWQQEQDAKVIQDLKARLDIVNESSTKALKMIEELEKTMYSKEDVSQLISLLKQTTEYEVLQSFRDKVEQFKKK